MAVNITSMTTLRAVMLLCIILFVCSACTTTPNQYEVVSVNKSQLLSGSPSDTANKALDKACMSWNLKNQDVKEFFQHSKKLKTPRKYYHDFDDLPCIINGIIKFEGNEYNFKINAASKATLTRGDEIIYMGCSDNICSQWSLISPDLP